MQTHPNRALYLTLKYWRSAGLQHLDLPEIIDEEEEKNPEDDLNQIKNTYTNCTLCNLHQDRKHIVFGKGNPKADLVIIGSGPDADSESRQIPFAGEQLELLNRMLEKMGVSPDQVYYTMITKCRPKNDRTPEAIEVNVCNKILEQELHAIQPKIICTMGTIASNGLLEINAPISKIRGQIKNWRNIPVMPTYSPAFLLKKKYARHEVWQDMQNVLAILNKKN